jgi:integrase
MARLYCKKGNYYVRFYDNTKSPARKTVTLNTRDRSVGEAALKRLEVHYAEGRFDPWAPPERPPARLSEAVAAFCEAKAHRAPNTLRLYRTVLNGLLDHVGDILVRDVVPSDLLAFLDSRDLNETGRDAYFTRLKAFFRWCRREGHAEEVVTNRVDVPKGPSVFPHWLSRSEFEHLISTMRKASDRAHDDEVGWLIPLVVVATYTGLRLGELTSLRWRDVDLDRRQLTVRHRATSRTKSRRDRIVPIARVAEETLRRLEAMGSGEHVFAGAGGGRVNKEYASKSFLRYRRRAGLPEEIHFHSLRHTCASWLVQGGVALVRVKEILGHASIQTTMRYAHLAPTTALEEVDRAMG